VDIQDPIQHSQSISTLRKLLRLVEARGRVMVCEDPEGKLEDLRVFTAAPLNNHIT
jgi:hypothetical protein